MIDLKKLLVDNNITGLAIIASVDDKGNFSMQSSSHKLDPLQDIGIAALIADNAIRCHTSEGGSLNSTFTRE